MSSLRSSWPSGVISGGRLSTLRVPINHPCSSRRVLVFVEGFAESVSSVDCQVGEL
ncbi:hypothetical protein GA0115260_112251, partial [Streptomyces sp. MnatMP-M27]